MVPTPHIDRRRDFIESTFTEMMFWHALAAAGASHYGGLETITDIVQHVAVPEWFRWKAKA